MATLFLIRHGLTEQTGSHLYGRTKGIRLSERGREQAQTLVARFEGVRLSAIYASPLERCLETAAPLAADHGLRVVRVPGLVEMDAGTWTGRSLRALARTTRWAQIQRTPSGTGFPEGERFMDANARLVRAVTEIAGRHPRDRVAVVSHSDNIRMLLAHVAGAHLDQFQRIVIDTGSVSVVALGGSAPRLLLANDTRGDLRRFGGARRGTYGT